MARCRNCGRQINCPRINGPVSSENAARIEQACNGITTPTEDLYGVTADRIRFDTCCDTRIGGCYEFDSRMRCTYWPSFAHPRWLPCDILYSRRI